MAELATNDFMSVSVGDLLDIESAMRVCDTEKSNVEYHQMLQRLAEMDLSNKIRTMVRYSWLDPYFDEAKKWCSMRCKEQNPDTICHEHTCYDILVENLQDIFGVSTLEILDMQYVNYDNGDRWITFTTDSDYVFRLAVPNTKKITVDNMASYRFGKMCLYYKSSKLTYSMNTSYTYDVADLKTDMNEFITNPKFEKHISKFEYKGE